MKYVTDISGIPDFSDCPEDPIHDYSISDRKIGILTDGNPYMLKFSEKQKKPYDYALRYEEYY